MNLLISTEGDVLGVTLTKDNAYRHKNKLHLPVIVVTSLAELKLLGADILQKLLQDYQVDSYSELWHELSKAKGLPKWGKISVKDVMRAMYTREPALELTEEELIEAIPGASLTSVVTAISMLKNPKYSDGSTINIKHIDGKYRRI